MKTKKITYTHDELVQLRQGGVITELDFIQMHPDNVLQEETLLSSRYQVARRERTIHARMREMVKELMEDETFQTFLTEAGDGMCVSYKI